MEGPLEIKHSTTGTAEPIKSETLLQNSDSSERGDGAASPPNCSICLGKLVNTSFTDSCLHQFCFTCLLQWSKIKTECPLCKQTFKSIIHNVRSEEDYDQYHVPRELASQIPPPQVTTTLDINLDVDENWANVGLRPFVYRTTMTGFRRQGRLLNAEQVMRREQLPSMAPQVPREERRRRRTNPTDYRRTVYRHGIWATSLPDIFGRFRECSADYYRRQPRELDRLVPWLNRELQVLLNNEHVAYVLGRIMDALIQYDIRSSEFRDIVRPYFNVHTDHFVHELLNFARTNFDLIGYDQSVTYLPHGLSNEYVPGIVSPTSTSSSSNSNSSSGSGSGGNHGIGRGGNCISGGISSNSSVTSDNSDIRILDEAIDLRMNTVMAGVTLPRRPINQPGKRDSMESPSTVGQLFGAVGTCYNVPELLILSSSSGSDGECEVIGYIKPRHERTPEIIELLSSDSEPTNLPRTSYENIRSTLGGTFSENLPSTSRATKDGGSSLSSCSPTSIDDDSDSDYVDERQSRRLSQKRLKKSSRVRKAIVQKRKRHPTTYNRNNRRSTNTYSSGCESDFKKRNRAKTSAKNRIRSDTSESSSSESLRAKCEEKRSRKTGYKDAAKASTEQVKLIKREANYSCNEDSCDGSDSSSSAAETDSKAKKGNKCHRQYKLKRKRSRSSSDCAAKDGGKTTRSKERTSTLVKLRSSSNKDRIAKYSESRQSRSKSISESSNTSERDKKSSYERRKSRDTSEYRSQDRDSASTVRKDASRRQRKSKSKKKARCYSSDSEDSNDRLRSSSQCSSNRSDKSYLHWKKSKRRERRKDDESHDRSVNRTFSSLQSNTSSSTTQMKPVVSSKNDKYPIKHSVDCKEKHKSCKVYKGSRHRKNENRSRPKKRRRHLRSSSISDSG